MMNFATKFLAALAVPPLLLAIWLAFSNLVSFSSSTPHDLEGFEPPVAVVRENTSGAAEAPIQGAPAARNTHASVSSWLSTIQSESDPDVRSRLLAEAVESITDFRAALDVLTSSTEASNDSSSIFRQLALRRWAKLEPAAAATWTAQLAGSPAYADSVRQVATVWASSEPAPAASWALALPDGAKPAAVLSVSIEAARTDPVLALDSAGKIPPSVERDETLLHGISQWASSDPTMAAQWAADIPDANLRERLVAAAAIAGAEQHADAAATLVAHSLSPGEEQDRAAVAIVQRWAQTSPQAAADWVSQFPDTLARSAAAENLVMIWSAQDRQAADQWVQSLPEGSLRASASAALARDPRPASLARIR